MKKLTLTFCALLALVVMAPALYADGPEKYSGKEKEVMQPAPPVCDFYRAHEWDLDIWAAYAFASDTGQFDVPNDDPFSHPGSDNDPFFSDTTTGFFGEPKIYNPNERVNIGQVSKNQLFGRDDTFGGGADIKYFWSRYLGVGVEALGLAAKRNFAGGSLLTLTGRFPFGRFAPYVTGGMGFIDGGATLYKFFNEQATKTGFPPGTLPVDQGTYVLKEREFWTTDAVDNNHVRALGQIGVGLEFRVTCHVGLMADVTWNFVFGQENHPAVSSLITENGQNVIITSVTPPGIVTSSTSTPNVNTAFGLRPGHSSDNQDFGLARFGVTFSY
jgi:hypothetical protein